MENWAEEINVKIRNSLEGTREKDIRFFRVEEFKRNIIRVGTFSSGCQFCQNQKINISETVEKIDEAIHVPGKSRREYDKLISRLNTHIQKEHGFYTPFYFTYLYSFFGMVTGTLFGYVLFLLFPEYNWAMLSLGFAICLIVGYFWGNIKDKKIRSEKKLM
ncbi:MAG: hypothetical protein HN778_19710 [Prolixibacteraceae bacterium]|jgi:hypothetical protein|nr:hypothetical protein [Prolixibacteraceae bacterium]MBT6007351.1 hypothetical protein [Prolixibacteraceae bacterium]MBT6998193.1 hypothetical protein [Prolixibacteraceae bacterium]MBT7397064.1 hypothetical protein [Prolixibacteraceae bacterium]